MKKMILPAILLTLFLTAGLMPVCSETVYAASGDPVMSLGASVLDKKVNTDDMQEVKIGSKYSQFYVVGYDGHGISTAKKGVVTLFMDNVGNYSTFNADGTNKYAGSDLQSSIDERLNTEFTDGERGAIKPRRLEGGGVNYGADGYDGSKMAGDSVDKALLWPLSAAEVSELTSKARKSYAYQGAYWLRTPGSGDGFAAYVNWPDADIIETGKEVTYSSYFRGAMDIDLSAVIFTSDYNMGKQCGDEGADSLAWIGSSSGNLCKFTLRDDVHKGFAVTSVESDNGTTLKIRYEGAVTGENEHISAVIVSSSDAIKYYGRLGAASDASDAAVTVNTAGKWDPAGGDRLYVFNEQCNGMDYTDYSSDLFEITEAMIGDDGSWEGSGTEKDPYIIKSPLGWSTLADYVNGGQSTEGKYFRLGNDMRVTEMVGTADTPFSGVFDGGGHKLIFSYTTSENYCAPFRYTDGAVIANLIVGGTIKTSAQFAAGFVAKAYHSCTITNCASSINIDSSFGRSASHSGFVSEGPSVIIVGSVFNGSITGGASTYCGGFLGWTEDSNSNVIDCMFDASAMDTVSNTANFIRNDGANQNCYYTWEIGQGRDRGKKAVSVTEGKGVDPIGFGNGRVYNVSGITAYRPGLMYNGVFYAGKGEQISLTLTNPGDAWVYEATAGEFTGSGTEYTLAMPEDDVIINRYRTTLEAPENVRIRVNATENGMLDQEDGFTAEWTAVDGADGYYIIPYKVVDGKEVPFSDPIRVSDASEGGETTGYRLFKNAVLDSRGDSGIYTFEVYAFSNRGFSSDTVHSSDQVDITRINLDSGDHSDDFYVLTGSVISGCIRDYFKDGPRYYYILEDEEHYYYDEWDEDKVAVLGFVPKPKYRYDSMDAIRAAAYLIPGLKRSEEKAVTDVKVYIILQTDLCTDGEMHNFKDNVSKKATPEPAPEGYGYMERTCNKCGHNEFVMIQYVASFVLSGESFTYTGKEIRPAVTVKTGTGETLEAGVDYTIKSSNTRRGTRATAKVILQGKYYEGSKELTFTITGAPPVTKPAVVKGKVYSSGGQKYTVTAVPGKGGQGTVAFKAAKNAKKVTVPATVKLADGKTYKVTVISAKAFTGKKIRTVTIGKNVKTIKKYAFKGSRATKLIVKTKRLTRKSVRGSLKGSKVTVVQVKVGKKSVNKKYVKKYKRIFTKKNAGRKVKVR